MKFVSFTQLILRKLMEFGALMRLDMKKAPLLIAVARQAAPAPTGVTITLNCPIIASQLSRSQ
jgi:hypothetical protein